MRFGLVLCWLGLHRWSEPVLGHRLGLGKIAERYCARCKNLSVKLAE